MGSRIQAEDFDTGGESVAYNDTTDQNQYDTSYRDTAVDIRETQDQSGAYNIGFFQESEWLEYTVNSTAGTYDIRLRVATARDDRKLRLSLGGETLETVDVPNTGGWREWETVTVENVSIDADGTQVLRVEAVNSGIDFNWIEFEKDGPSNAREQQPYTGSASVLASRIQAQNFDTGGEGVAYHDTTDQNQYDISFRDTAVDIRGTTDVSGKYNVGYFEEGEWLEYTVNSTAGTYDINLRVATDRDDRKLRLSLGGETLRTVDVPNTGGWREWQTVTVEDVSVDADGTQVLRVEAVNSGIDFNWVEFEWEGDGSGAGTQRPYGDGPAPLPGRVQAQHYDLGGEGVAYDDTTPGNSYPNDFRPGDDVDVRETYEEPGEYDIEFDAGEWVEYTVDTRPGTYNVHIRAATGNRFDPELRVSLGGNNVTTVTVPNTQQWETLTVENVTVDTNGTQVLRVESLDSEIDFNWIEFERVDDDPDAGSQRPYGDGPAPLPGRVQAQHYDLGGEGVAYSDTTAGNEYDNDFRPGDDVDVRETQDRSGAYNVGFFEEGEWLEYTVNASSGTYDVRLRVATARDDRKLRLSLGGETLRTVDVPNTGGWSQWQTVTVEDVSVDADGKQVLRVEPVNSGIDVNWIAFDEASTLPSGDLQVDVRQVVRPEFPDVTVFGSVRDADGNPISGLSADDVTISEDGRDQTIEAVEPVDTTGGSSVSVSLVVDRSGSMDGTKLGDAKDAANEFVYQFGAGDEGQVIAFDTRLAFKQRWTTDTRRLTAAINDIESGSNTALWRATIEGVEQADPRVGRSAVVVLTDGKNNEPPNDVERAIDTAQTAGVPVYTIGLGSDVQEDKLRRLAAETGGDYYFSPDSSELADIYDQIRQSITTEYEITYRTSNTATDGTNRTVALVARDGGDVGSDTGAYRAPCAPLPTADYEYDPGNVEEGEGVSFDASPSSPNGGSLVSYEWDFDNDGVVDASGQTTTHTYPSAGTYRARLTVEKDCGASDVKIKPVTVDTATPPNRSQQPFRGGPASIPGRIQAQNFDDGPEGDAYNDTTVGNEYNTTYRDGSVDIRQTQDVSGEYNIGYFDEGDWLEYTVDATSGTYDVRLRIATDRDNRQLRLTLDGETLRTVDIQNTGGWREWKTITVEDVSIDDDGRQVLRVEPVNSGIDLNWIEFERADDSGSLSATRTIASQTVRAGDTTEVTVTIQTAGTSDDLRFVDGFDPSLSASVVNDDGATISSPADDEVAASWGGVSEATITYEVTVPDDAPVGTTYDLSGTVEDRDAGSEVSIQGDTTIEVGEPNPVAEYANDQGVVESTGLLDAAADFRDGEIGADLLLNVAAAFRSGKPVT